jgi:hypothetical protein
VARRWAERQVQMRRRPPGPARAAQRLRLGTDGTDLRSEPHRPPMPPRSACGHRESTKSRLLKNR